MDISIYIMEMWDSIEHDTWQSEETCASCAWVNGGIMPLDGSNKVIELVVYSQYYWKKWRRWIDSRIA